MATLERMGRPSQVMRISEGLGMYDRHRIDPDAPVCDSIDEWRDAKTARQEPAEPEYKQRL